MSQFLVVQFKVSAKGSLARPTGYETVAVELPVKHVADWKVERPHLKFSDEEITNRIGPAGRYRRCWKIFTLDQQPPQRARNPLARVLATAFSDYE